MLIKFIVRKGVNYVTLTDTVDGITYEQTYKTGEPYDILKAKFKQYVKENQK